MSERAKRFMGWWQNPRSASRRRAVLVRACVALLRRCLPAAGASAACCVPASRCLACPTAPWLGQAAARPRGADDRAAFSARSIGDRTRRRGQAALRFRARRAPRHRRRLAMLAGCPRAAAVARRVRGHRVRRRQRGRRPAPARAAHAAAAGGRRRLAGRQPAVGARRPAAARAAAGGSPSWC